MLKKTIGCVAGAVTGFLNGFFGAGGGMAAVPMLKMSGLKTVKAHATSLMMMLPLSMASGWFYLQSGRFRFQDVLVYIPGGIVGAVVGAWLLPRLQSKWIRRVFGLLVLYSAVRLLLK